ncbi:MAG: extracellular solute-binding protein [Chloroflexi bacterium]|nr:extracellular solute-binding protein [Chloroflexota bacterium]
MAKRLLLLLTFLFLAACQSPPETETPRPTTPALTKTPRPTATPLPTSNFDVEEADLNGTEIEIWHTFFGAPAALLELQIADFNEENPWGITLRASYQGSYNMLFYNVMDSAERPSLIVALPEQISVWEEEGSVKDLASYISDPIWGFTPAEKSDFPSVFLEQDQHGERTLALPAQRTAHFILYNKSWGEELGFDAAPLDFDEFKEQACAANQAMRTDEDFENDGKGGWIIDYESNGVLSWMRGFDGSPFANDAYQFISDENIRTLKALKILYDDQCAWLTTSKTPYEQFALRSALFISASMEEFTDIKRTFAQTGSTDEWTVIPFPGQERTALVTYGSSYALLETEDAEALASWLFLKWMLTPQNQAKWVKSTGLFPLRISALDELSDYEKANPQWAEAVDLIAQAEIYPQLASWHKVRYLLGDGVEFIFRSNVQSGSVAAILAQMNDAARALSE